MKKIRFRLNTYLKVLLVMSAMFISIVLLAFSGNQKIKINNENQIAGSMKIKISVGNKVFTVTLENNPTAIAFKAKLPLKVDMSELHSNEKYFDLPSNLPSDPSNPKTIHTGDLMLYGSNTLVLFYKTFPTSYNYTMLGRIDNPLVLEDAFGSGSVTVTFEAK
ncbi:MAG: cyclophilin-like fold protein [Bacteroidota bacterium]